MDSPAPFYSNDAAKIFEFIDRIETGITHVNSPTVAAKRSFLSAA